MTYLTRKNRILTSYQTSQIYLWLENWRWQYEPSISLHQPFILTAAKTFQINNSALHIKHHLLSDRIKEIKRHHTRATFCDISKSYDGNTGGKFTCLVPKISFSEKAVENLFFIHWTDSNTLKQQYIIASQTLMLKRKKQHSSTKIYPTIILLE